MNALHRGEWTMPFIIMKKGGVEPWKKETRCFELLSHCSVGNPIGLGLGLGSAAGYWTYHNRYSKASCRRHGLWEAGLHQ